MTSQNNHRAKITTVLKMSFHLQPSYYNFGSDKFTVG